MIESSRVDHFDQGYEDPPLMCVCVCVGGGGGVRD